MTIHAAKLELWDRLRAGNALNGREMKSREGRVDLSGLELPAPKVVNQFNFGRASVAQVEPTATIRGVKWQNLDFAGSRLGGLRLFDCEIINCSFDSCHLQDMRIWSSKILETSFRGADLRKAALGGLEKGQRNVFSKVDFTEADLRQTMYTAAEFDQCIFRNAKLVKIDFQTSSFSDCVFEGELSDVLFYRRAFNGESLPPNEMKNVDFTRAKLRHVEFRGLNLDRVRLPSDSENIATSSHSATLDKLIGSLQSHQDTTGRKLLAFLSVLRKWAAPGEARGVINLGDIADIAGAEGVDRIRKLLAQ
jgi:uncharacterized protein YjbI with pentapeptide repeats